MAAGSAYTDEELERERVKDKAFFQQGEEPMQIRIDVHAGAKRSEVKNMTLMMMVLLIHD